MSKLAKDDPFPTLPRRVCGAVVDGFGEDSANSIAPEIAAGGSHADIAQKRGRPRSNKEPPWVATGVSKATWYRRRKKDER